MDSVLGKWFSTSSPQKLLAHLRKATISTEAFKRQSTQRCQLTDLLVYKGGQPLL